MTKLINITRRLLPIALLTLTASIVSAQGYYDDDIYYTPPKKSENVQKKVQNTRQTTARTTGSYISSTHVTDYDAADTYAVPAGSLNMDVDTYNRRGQFLVADSVESQPRQDGDFSYTQRIERFHNPDIVSGSDDQDLQEVYSYAMQQPQNINIYVIDNDPWYWNTWGPSWSWTWRYGNPWYWNSWGPSWSLTWGGWSPYWSWSWHPSWTWGWHHPSWSWGWSPSWGWGHALGHAHAWRPNTPSGSYRPHRPVGGGSIATHRPVGNHSAGTRRPGYTPSNNTSAINRPGNMGRGRNGRTTVMPATTTRPGNYAPASTVNSSSTSNARPGNMGRGRSNNEGYRSSARPSSSSNSGYRSSSNTNNYRPSNNSGSSYRSNGSSYSRGSSGSHSSGSGNHHGGGGVGGRGRR